MVELKIGDLIGDSGFKIGEILPELGVIVGYDCYEDNIPIDLIVAYFDGMGFTNVDEKCEVICKDIEAEFGYTFILMEDVIKNEDGTLKYNPNFYEDEEWEDSFCDDWSDIEWDGEWDDYGDDD